MLWKTLYAQERTSSRKYGASSVAANCKRSTSRLRDAASSMCRERHRDQGQHDGDVPDEPQRAQAQCSDVCLGGREYRHRERRMDGIHDQAPGQEPSHADREQLHFQERERLLRQEPDQTEEQREPLDGPVDRQDEADDPRGQAWRGARRDRSLRCAGAGCRAAPDSDAARRRTAPARRPTGPGPRSRDRATH